VRLRAEWKRGLGRERKKRAFLGGSKGKAVRAGEVVTDVNGVTWKVGGRFKARGRRGCFLIVEVSFKVVIEMISMNFVSDFSKLS
jgi:hypothetical protein